MDYLSVFICPFLIFPDRASSSTNRNPFSKTPFRPRSTPSQPRSMDYDITPPSVIPKQQLRKNMIKQEMDEESVEPARKVRRSEVIVKEEPKDETEEFTEKSEDQKHGFGKIR